MHLDWPCGPQGFVSGQGGGISRLHVSEEDAEKVGLSTFLRANTFLCVVPSRSAFVDFSLFGVRAILFMIIIFAHGTFQLELAASCTYSNKTIQNIKSLKHKKHIKIRL
jgi:hypothetical protein